MYGPEKEQEFIDALKNLSGRVNACKAVGICYDTFQDWMVRKPQFAEEVKKAENEARQSGKELAIKCIFKNIQDGTWTAGAWWLERNFPEEFKERKHVESEGKTKQVITIGGQEIEF